MKQSHAIISDHVFRGRRSGHINTITNMIYNAKFFNNKVAFQKLCRLCIGDIPKGRFDVIVPINTRDSKFNLPERMAKVIGKELKISVINALNKKNKQCTTQVKGMRVLVFDDVIYTGQTLTIATQAVKAAGAKTVTGFAIARSRTYEKTEPVRTNKNHQFNQHSIKKTSSA